MPNPIKATQDYLRSSWGEIKKVTWPTRETTIRYSAIVIVVSLAVAAFFARLDPLCVSFVGMFAAQASRPIIIVKTTSVFIDITRHSRFTYDALTLRRALFL